MKVQSVLVPRSLYKRESSAAAWVRRHGWKVLKVDVTTNFYRFRQLPPPKRRKKYIMHKLPNGVMLVMFA